MKEIDMIEVLLPGYILFDNKTKGNKAQNTEHDKLAKTKLITTSVDKLLCADPKYMKLVSIKGNFYELVQ